MTTKKQIGGIFLGFVLGGAIGGTLALLYAPMSGKHLRNNINKKANDLAEDGKRITNDTWNEVKDKAESILESANDVLNTNVDRVVNKTEKVKNAFKAGYDAYNDERNSGSHRKREKTDHSH
jgi:gas vesicle protein